MFKLLDDWRIVLWNAWSSWLMAGSFILDIITAMIPFVAPEKNNAWFAIGSAAVTVLAMWSRLLVQRKMDYKRADFAATTASAPLDTR